MIVGSESSKVSMDIISQKVGGGMEKLIPYRKGKLFGFCTPNKKIVVEPQFETVDRFVEGFAPVSKDCQHGIINMLGDIIIPLEYDVTGFYFSEGLLEVCKNNKFGFVNFANEIRIPIKFDFTHPFKEGLAGVQIGKKWGYINKKGEMVIEPKYDWVQDFKEGIAEVQLNTWITYIDKNGTEYSEED